MTSPTVTPKVKARIMLQHIDEFISTTDSQLDFNIYFIGRQHEKHVYARGYRNS